MKQQKESLMTLAARAMDIPLCDLGKSAYIGFSGNREVLFEGCSGIIEYNESRIKLNVGKYMVVLSGNALSLRSMSDDTVIIEGFITGMEFVQ